MKKTFFAKLPFQNWLEEHKEILKILLAYSLPILFLLGILISSIWALVSSSKFISENLLIISMGILMIISLLIIWFVPKKQTMPLVDVEKETASPTFESVKERIKLEDDTRKTVAQVIGGIFLVLGLLSTYYTFELNRQGQIDARFRNAQDSINAPLGSSQRNGLFSFELLCEDSSINHERILELLLMYINEKSEVLKRPPLPLSAEKRDLSLVSTEKISDPDQNNAKETGDDSNVETERTSPEEKKANEEIERNELQKSILYATKILLDEKCGSKLSKYQYVSAGNIYPDVRYSLDDGLLKSLNYYKARFYSLGLARVSFEGSILQSANFTRANLFKANFSDSILIKSNFTNANVRGANFTNSNLSGAIFRSINFEKTNLTNANLSEANLVNTSFKDAILINTDFTGADLSYADFRGAVISKCKTSPSFAQLKKAIVDGSTWLPPELTEPERIELRWGTSIINIKDRPKSIYPNDLDIWQTR
jgi:uncharacterized protein YjbI with pentapeptide repeats